jgi:hypothetical protein
MFRMHASRRAVFASLATLPAIATASSAAEPRSTVARGFPDPIITAIARHRVALAAPGLIDELVEPARYAAAEQQIFASRDVLLATTPQTIVGAQALIVTIEDAEAAGEGQADTLKVVRRALDRLAARERV